MEKANAIILAGGRNTRIARNKAFIQLAGKTVLENTINILQKIFPQIIIVTNRKEAYLRFKAFVAVDLIKESGPLGGIFSGLCYSTSYYSFVIGSDMPFPQIGLIQLLFEKCTNQDVVIPETNGEVEPLFAVYSKNCLPVIFFAVYSKNCLPVIFDHLQKHDLRIRHILGELRVERVGEEEIDTVDPERLSFFNINTSEDLKKAQTLLSRASNSG